MPDSEPQQNIEVSLHHSLKEINGADWDALNQQAHPFLSYAFLSALEQSGSVGADTGWDPLYLTIANADGQLIGAAPHYIKYHSYGEYIFDHSWAHALERAGGQYYPKSLTAVPFTPVPGPRLLAHPEHPEAESALIAAMESLCRQNQISSAHINFIQEDNEAKLQAAGWAIRTGIQFHWHNDHYSDFDAFLVALSSRKRKNIRKERASLRQAGVSFEALTGNDLQPKHWDAFYGFYLSTIDRKWGGAYLTRSFFDEIAKSMPDQILLVIASRQGDMIAGALNFIGHDTLYGRNWGCSEDIPNLHFETCYYQAIDYAIANGLKRVEAGAQGIHKVQRGYLPVETKSAHFITHDGFREAIERYLQQENRHNAAEIDAILAESPYRQNT